MNFLPVDTPLGRMALAAEGQAITALYLPGRPTPRLAGHETPLLAEARGQLLAYLEGRLARFDLPLDPQGTAFQRAVWKALEAIPYGQTRCYADIAAAVESPKAVRAVGGANHRNPIPIFIPCHRVVGKGGGLTGYAGGLALKESLLKLEGVVLCGQS